ncbi:hypothetical protein [Crocinitomix catalasitica]|uniref:hypothetical protein n=1 Tax=Crocinitomix catalasitica TaxID=184607 RepID=UPI0012FA09B8|nr:hypothetical protein [Crocinitomix catalasitica]
MRNLLTIISICIAFSTTTSFCINYQPRCYIKEFIIDVVKLEDKQVLDKYFNSLEERLKYNLEYDDVAAFYSIIFEGIRSEINLNKRIKVKNVKNRHFKVQQEDYTLHLKLIDGEDIIEGFGIQKGDKVEGWI